jgi:multidrug efflux pump subunit AcrB
MSKILAEQPIGLGVHLVADQPVVVEHAVSDFTEALFEAVVIVLGISFLGLGLRAGLVVAIAIPLVLAITFVVMAYAGIAAVVPIMLFIMATILMIQLQSSHRLFLVFAVAPLALIGVVMALLPSGAPLGFVAILGVLALIGILIRNSVILIVQIEDLRKEGRPAWEAVVEATEHRMRPIMLTAAAASLALIPIAREIFWGPMAYAMMGGIIVGTVLTLLFLPALYVAWFRIKAPESAPVENHGKRKYDCPRITSRLVS